MGIEQHYTRTYGSRSERITISGIEILLPQRPPAKLIDGYERGKKQQYWRRTEKPSNWTRMTPKQKQEFIDLEYNRREEGYWFYNNGVPTYITGTHYFYLNYWQPKNQPLEYRYTDREFFLLWDWVVQQKHIHGMIFIKRRREGASTKAGCINYNMVSQYKNVTSGIQSMEEKHARMLFSDMIVNPFVRLSRLAPFFKPRHTGNTRPKEEIHFAIPPERITKKKLSEAAAEIDSWGEDTFMDDSASLESRITFGPAGEKHYDGHELIFYWGDEIGKTGGKVDVHRRHQIVKHSVEKNDKIVGKILYTSTVEEMEKDGAEACKKIWDESSPEELKKHGETTSGLVQYFNPAWRGYKLDRYGNDKLDETGYPEGKKILEARRKRYQDRGDRDGLNSYMRKFPFSVNEAFLPAASQCLFDSMIIDNRHLEITELEAEGAAPYVKGKLRWVQQIRPTGHNEHIKPRVQWVPDPDGFFLISREFDIDKTNQLVWDTHLSRWKPAATHKFIGGVDPYDYSVSSNRSTESKGAGAVFSRYNPLEEDEAGRFVMIYKGRPNTNKDFYDDMVKMSVFCGCEVVIEKNKVRCFDYFNDYGWGSFVARKLKISQTDKKRNIRQNLVEKGGEYTTISKKQAMADVIESYIYYNCHQIDFKEVLDEYRTVTLETANQHDLFIATGLALLGNIYAKRKSFTEKPIAYNIIQTFSL